MVKGYEAVPAKQQKFEITGDGVTKQFTLRHDLGTHVVCSMYDEDLKGYDGIPDRLLPGYVIYRFAQPIPKDKKYYVLLVG